MPSEETAYVVYFDLQDRRESKIHSASCVYYLGRDPEATTTRWDEGPYRSRQEAEAATEVTRGCGTCRPRDADPPGNCRPAVAPAWTIGGCVRRCRSAWRQMTAWWGRRL